MNNEGFKTGEAYSRIPLHEDLRNATRNFGFWWKTAKLEVLRRYSKSYLGILWMPISTIFFVGVVGILYSKILDISGEDYYLYVYIGYLSWLMIAETLSNGSNVFVGEFGIYSQSRYPLSGFSIKQTLVRAFQFIANFPIIVLLLLYSDRFSLINLAVSFIGLVILLINFCYFNIWAGIIVAKFRDLLFLIGTSTRFLFFITPIFWMPNALEGSWKSVFVIFNPFYHYIELIRAPLMNTAIESQTMFIVLGLTIFNIVFASILFKAKRTYILFYSS